ncbi:MAG: P1 family peptidase [Desulfobacteraceae bacterium]|nr:P1 family peptidase [Desulfobacteraceae bacterium]
MRKRLMEYGIQIGMLERGRQNSITDVPGVRVGHKTLVSNSPEVIRTGVTAIIPGDGDVYDAPVRGACSVINGFGKSIGLLQLEELGRIETPILLTNTLNTGLVSDALVEYTLSAHPACRSLNPVVGECNDSRLNQIERRSVSAADVGEALKAASGGPIQTGAVGSGTGMICFGYKGGIGTASRILNFDNTPFTIGALVLSNFGEAGDLTIKGRRIAPLVPGIPDDHLDGSIMIILGTDLPLSHRQLKRMSNRAAFGIARTGGRCGHTSGEIVIAFSTANRVPRSTKTAFVETRCLVENNNTMGPLFDGVIDCVEEAILDSLFTAESTTGKNGHTAHALPVEEMMKVYDLTSVTAR